MPRIPAAERPTPGFLPPEPREERTDARYLDGGLLRSVTVSYDLNSGTTRYRTSAESRYQVGDRQHRCWETHVHETSDRLPERSSYRGEAGHRIRMAARTIELRTRMSLESDAKSFQAGFHRSVFENDRLVREHRWEETVPRRFQ